jgi:hypothetical protein
MAFMADDYDRLFLAAKTLNPSADIDGPSSLARFLGESPQLMTNWKSRGLPKSRVRELARKVGCSADYVEFGDMPMTGDAATNGGAQALSAMEATRSEYDLSIHVKALRQSAKVIADAFGLQADDVLEAALKPEKAKKPGKPKEYLAGVLVIDPNKPMRPGAVWTVGDREITPQRKGRAR